MRFDFGIADQNDDRSIRRLLAENPMPGAVSVAFEREPDYFLGHGVMGESCLTVKAEERKSGKLAGIMCLASADRYINGSVRKVGYVGGVRIDSKFQGTMLPLRAMPYIRSMVKEGWPNLWFGAVVDENPTARALFVSRPRTSFPIPTTVSPIHTLGILTRPRFSRPLSDGLPGRRKPDTLSLISGDEIGWEPIVAFLNEWGSRREFFPCITVEDLAGDYRTPGLEQRDFHVALIDGEITGVCGLWDQSEFKQTVVHDYQGWLARTRPLINTFGPLVGMKKLPRIGGEMSSASLSFIAVRNDDLAVFHRLLTTAVGNAFSRGKDYLIAGFSQRDPLLAVAKKFRHILYRSTMYAFSFDGPLGDDSYDRDKVPYLEGAAL